MITHVDRPLIKGVDYIELSTKKAGEYKYELLRDVTFYFSEHIFGSDEIRSFRCKGNDGVTREWFELSRSQAVVRKGYRWNGNSPKKVVCGLRLGSPDFEGGFWGSTVEASLFHDNLFQFSCLHELVTAITLVVANWAYKNIAKQRKCKFATIIDFILRKWSKSNWGNPDQSVSCVIIFKI